MSKTYQQLTFSLDRGGEIQTTAYDGVSIGYSLGLHWDPTKGEEVAESKLEIHLSSDDARELAANLLKAADFADEAEKNKPKQRKY